MVYPRTEMSELLEITNCRSRENSDHDIQIVATETESLRTKKTLDYNHRKC